ncbi:MAG: methyltransferase domain-containing protein [Nannocystis sp.]|nr:methyltransferase domain-containing protein [Nannocystis sp.]MBA3547114.1 methyltransferase domain-containing protein [Nannocystis sp.]
MIGSLVTPDAWNLVGVGYTSRFAPTLAAYARTALALAQPAADAHILDVAAGPGTLALLAAPEVRRVSALDFSSGMIDRLRHEAAARGLANVEAIVGDGQALPYPDETFDAAFSMFGLIFFPDRARGLRELLRVLRPGRQAVIGSWAPLDPGAPPVILFELLRDASPEMPPTFPKLPLTDAEAMRHELREAGFEGIQVALVAHEFVAPSVDAFWHGQAEANVLVAAVRHAMTSAAWERVSQRVIEGLRAHLGDGAVRYPQTAIFGLGTRTGRAS